MTDQIIELDEADLSALNEGLSVWHGDVKIVHERNFAEYVSDVLDERPEFRNERDCVDREYDDHLYMRFFSMLPQELRKLLEDDDGVKVGGILSVEEDGQEYVEVELFDERDK